MTGRIMLGACGGLLIAATAWSLQAQGPPAGRGLGQKSGPRTTVAGPCVGNPNSPECFTSRLDQLDRAIANIDASIAELRARPARGGPSGPPIGQVGDQKNDGTTQYINDRIDELVKTVNDLVKRVNML